ncbi:MAG: hypothetical protein JW760_05715 [Spirochaetales bacterium]|nr:hypothetical protein [Spirochaetales bacterium]
MDKGDVFDRGNGEYEEYLEPLEDNRDKTMVYTREQKAPYRELRYLSSTPRGYLPENFRKIGPREKNRLMVVYARSPLVNLETFQGFD